ncbi:RraA family protein [Propylenella binzhouense]|uniref:Putative 4-hydroxy-4-methyl-2-oxoglutarate aldolase n=1 Tax=Propylenella binzhouense TaxID=2555902 RepID=A0A964WVN4_9HYPH|nr:RraA family protein [Propylenella binzhouense]MYZ50422.1 RraA family protein [Propylenella binzhouense]
MTESRSEALARLGAYRTPMVYDAIERFGIRPKNEGYTDGSLKCLFPALGAFVGYAWTGKIVGELPEAEGERILPWREVWRHLGAAPRPSIAVVQDLDQPAGRGCAWGDVGVAIFQALGCVAAVTNGSARDVREVEALGFGLLAGGLVVGHAHVRFVEVGTPVKVGGLVVRPGDLVHADEHGALVIPPEVDLGELVRVIDHVIAAEARVKEYCRAPGFDIDALDELHTWSMETAG